MLQAPSANGKQGRWWSKIFGSGLKCIQIKYRPGKDNCTADASSHFPVSSLLEKELISTTQIAIVQCEGSTHILELLAAPSHQQLSELLIETAKGSRTPITVVFYTECNIARKQQCSTYSCYPSITFHSNRWSTFLCQSLVS